MMDYPMRYQMVWALAYAASISAGWSNEQAARKADEAVKAFRERLSSGAL